MIAAISGAISALSVAISALSVVIWVISVAFLVILSVAVLVKLHSSVTELLLLVIWLFFPDLLSEEYINIQFKTVE